MATKVAGILGKKVGMTQLFDSKGDVRPVTGAAGWSVRVTQHKSATRDGYEAAQIGLVEFVRNRGDQAGAGTLSEEQSSSGEVYARSAAGG